VLDESDETGNRMCRRRWSLVVGEDKVTTTRAEGSGPVDALTKAMRQGAGEVVPGRAAVAAGHIQRGPRSTWWRTTRGACARDVSFHAEGHPSWTTRGREQRPEPGGR